MNKTAIQKQVHWVLLALACLLMLTAFLFTGVTRNYSDPKDQLGQFETQLNTRNILAKKLLLRFSTDSLKLNYSTFQSFSNQLPEYFNLFVLRDNRLVFWSDNSVPIDFENADSLRYQRILKTGNGIYQINSASKGKFVYFLTDLIKYSYRYQNDYLTSDFNPAYGLHQSYDLVSAPTRFPVKAQSGNVLFYVKPGEEPLPGESQLFVAFLLYTLAYLILVIALYRLYRKYSSVKTNLRVFLLFVLNIIIIRFLLFYFKIPGVLYTSDLFSPLYFASSRYLPSLGDLLANVVTCVLLLYFFYKTQESKKASESSNSLVNWSLSALFITLSVLSFYLCCYLIDTLIVNSSFRLDLGNIMEFSFYSLAGFFIIALLLAGYFLFSYQLFRLSCEKSKTKATILLFIAINAVLYLAAIKTGFFHPEPVNLLLQFFFLIVIVLVSKGILRLPHITALTLFVLILTSVSAYSLSVRKAQKEKDERKLMAVRLSSDRDKMAEFLFSDIEKAILSDTAVKGLFIKAWSIPADENKCIEYIRNKYFRGFWSKYSVQVTLCYPEKILQIKPSNYLIGCQQYFSGIINNLGDKTASPSLYFIRESYDASSYIANISYANRADTASKAYIVIELNRKYVPKGLGYPELLLDRSFTTFNDISGYSYAIYFKNELVKNVGDYTYSTNETEDITYPDDFHFYDKNGFNHLFHIINKDTSIVISTENEDLLDKLAPFTFQFIFHIVLLLIISGLISLRGLRLKRNLDLKTRLQIMLVMLILFSSISVGISTILNIKRLNATKNRDMLSEKAHSVLIEFENKLADFDILDHTQKAYMEELLTKFSLVFFSDINLYDINGQLLASSRPQIFVEGLMSDRMTAEAYRQLALNKRTFYVMNEQIGNYDYLSAFIPFRNNQNKLTAYINLPYFAREQEMQKEISSFLVAFVNIFVILTAFAVFISLLIGNYLTRPLQLIRNRFTSLNLNKANEKITYSRQDELGDLVNEYNLMIDKLADSAEKLARSERESAWREMARQVAHEIKNPLTPMKLSIQHLRKTYHDNTPDWESRFERTAQTLISQIDSLASIATAFSDFAKLPAPANEKVELTGIIRNTLGLFSQHPDINFIFTVPENNCFVFADEKQLSRVFINLLNNAVQAFPAEQKGQVNIRLRSLDSVHRIDISDNGIGIAELEKVKIFSPNFTTKSGGMGLGLAMVKNIIDSAGGEISFVSEETKGTTFTILLPAYKD